MKEPVAGPEGGEMGVLLGLAHAFGDRLRIGILDRVHAERVGDME